MTHPFSLPLAWHGERLTAEECEKQIIEAYSRSDVVDVRRHELDITIDHRLGKDFPAQRREALWAIQREIDARLVSVDALSSIKDLLRGKMPGISRVQVYYLFKKYGCILGLNELEMFFLDESEKLAA